MHDKNNEKKFFIIISEEHKNQEVDKNSTANVLNKTIFEINHLKDIVQKFVEATEYMLRIKQSNRAVRS